MTFKIIPGYGPFENGGIPLHLAPKKNSKKKYPSELDCINIANPTQLDFKNEKQVFRFS